MTDAVYSL